MAGYAAATRIQRVEIHSRLPAAAWRQRQDVTAEPATGRPAIVDLGDPGLDVAIAQRLADIRVYLGQLTWYLFNEEGWR